MHLVDGYPLIVTDSFRECRDFYGRWFGFTVTFEADWIVVLASANGSLTIGFMHSDHPTSPPSPAPHAGDGMFLTLQVADARGEFQRVVEAGLRCNLELTEEPWGQLRFGVVDPAGMWVDVVEQVEPADGWWEPYLSE